jgi:hypothetical protein
MHGVNAHFSLHDVNAYARFGFDFGDGVHRWMAEYTPTGFCMHVVSFILSSLQRSSSRVCLFEAGAQTAVTR